MSSTPESCAPTAEGCLRCQVSPRLTGSRNAALLLGPLDDDARATLVAALEAHALAITVYGPIFVLAGVRSQLKALVPGFQEMFSPYTQQCIQAAYVPCGVSTVEDALAGLLHAKPLATLLVEIEHEWVRDALADDWLTSVFHPILTADTSELFAYECLLRARHPETEELIGAWPIIQACNHLNIQHQLDQRARIAAIRAAATLESPVDKFFINFLPNTIYDPEICLRTTMATADEYGIDVDRLVFEVVETERIVDMDHLNHTLAYYRKRRMQTAVDDMGAGHTSLEYLTALRPDYVKLDRDVVVEAALHPDKRRELETLVQIARDMEIAVIAEGIETWEQRQVCIEAGVDYLQGFLFARPANPPQPIMLPGETAYRKAA